MDKDYNNLKINIKRRSSINFNIHDSKVFSSGNFRCKLRWKIVLLSFDNLIVHTKPQFVSVISMLIDSTDPDKGRGGITPQGSLISKMQDTKF